ncbi:MAG TPA: CPBP family glutamic-type intramembrane protease [Luteibacter sp.]|uniref:CPBP family glutamic-type intramembrane protease n=1 Tax=Luteibacter sp. TaxID=1886636 RepID=UPI002C76F2F5|nr:CPBP family glutamic-type intramembrane protease [Luteibacter sp.]HVI55627.1 CPBP family glutamic-type intramembrane protease [Luteibacter sp.]
MLKLPPRWTAAAAVLLAVASLFVLPWFAAAVVRGAIERDSANDRATYAAGSSPWRWHFRGSDDVVAGRAFGGGRLQQAARGLQVQATDGTPFEVGLPLRREADLRALTTLRLEGFASAPGRYGLAVRQTLQAPEIRADLGEWRPEALSRALPLDRLTWRDATGHKVNAPGRAAMLRIVATLPAGKTLTLREAALVPSPGWLPPAAMALPGGLTAEGLLDWRDDRLATSPTASFGLARAQPSAPAWQPWAAPLLYLLVLVIVPRIRVTMTSGDPEAPTNAKAGPVEALLVLAGPLWFIAGLGLSVRPAAPAVAMFLLGVAYALLLAGRRRLPRWHWFGAWHAAGWPLLALPVTIAILAVAGHAPVWPTAGRALLYIGWAFFQQWLILAVVAALLARALPRPLAVLLAALAFALLHTPNGLLMQLCFVAELGWAWWYLHRRALLPVALAHAFSALLLQACLAGGILRSLEVSARFLG